MVLVYIAVGGAAGALARYGISGWVYQRFAVGFPWGTLAVNVIGSLLLGLTVAWFEGTVTSPELKRAIAVGFLGAFTTFSTFAYESVVLVQNGQWGRAGGYAVLSVALGVAAIVAGFALGSGVVKVRG